MKYCRTLIGVAAVALMTSACSGGTEDKAPPAPKEEAAAPAEDAAAPAEEAAPAPAPAPAAGTPAKDDVSTLDGTVFASFTGDAAKGKIVFAQCRTCHVTDAGVNRTGPSLHQIIGRELGTVEGFRYSAANQASDVVWTKEKLFQYLEKPQRVIPGTTMVFPGIPDAQRRADLIAYLENPS